MDPQYFDNTTKAGTSMGAILTLLANINSGDLLKTGMLSALGAIISFCISSGLKLLVKFLKTQWRQKW